MLYIGNLTISIATIIMFPIKFLIKYGHFSQSVTDVRKECCNFCKTVCNFYSTFCLAYIDIVLSHSLFPFFRIYGRPIFVSIRLYTYICTYIRAWYRPIVGERRESWYGRANNERIPITLRGEYKGGAILISQKCSIPRWLSHAPFCRVCVALVRGSPIGICGCVLARHTLDFAECVQARADYS